MKKNMSKLGGPGLPDLAPGRAMADPKTWVVIIPPLLSRAVIVTPNKTRAMHL